MPSFDLVCVTPCVPTLYEILARFLPTSLANCFAQLARKVKYSRLFLCHFDKMSQYGTIIVSFWQSGRCYLFTRWLLLFYTLLLPFHSHAYPALKPIKPLPHFWSTSGTILATARSGVIYTVKLLIVRDQTMPRPDLVQHILSTF